MSTIIIALPTLNTIVQAISKTISNSDRLQKIIASMEDANKLKSEEEIDSVFKKIKCISLPL